MGKETRALLWRLWAIFFLALAVSVMLVLWMTRDFRKTMVEHDYGAAGYLLGHPEEAVAAAFTKVKTVFELEAGRRVLHAAGYSEDTDSVLIPAVAAYRRHTIILFGGMLFGIFSAVFVTVGFYIRSQRAMIAKADAVIASFLEGDTDRRIHSQEAGAWYGLFHRINELATILSAQAEHERQTRLFLQDMISDVSHQLKTPLAALRMYHEIMAEDSADRETIRAFGHKSLREIRRVEDVVYTLLKIASLTERFETLAARESKEIVLRGRSDVTLCCDALWLSEALGNLVKNALEHTGRGGRILIGWERTALLTNIVVEDNGKGIHPEDIHNIFKRFYRSRFSQDTQGIGLGLPLAKAIVEAHQGTISVTSRVGQGSRFVLSFFHLTER